jgi:NAD-dependent SIR2 family protein deacetylase/cold shock CspA family protein
MVLTGAGCSTASGIPEYRDAEGAWKSRPPVSYADFVASPAVRRRYWARSLVGWTRVAAAVPNAAHAALARLERTGHVHTLVTQNVDGLHQRAGSRRVVDLHGRLQEVECVECGGHVSRDDLQALLLAWNGAAEVAAESRARPDGDAEVEPDGDAFRVPDCPACGGILKPAVVFFGESVPKGRVDTALRALAEADALLVVGSSLMVFSGYRFCLAARELGKPIAAVNLGRGRADHLLDLRVPADCGPALQRLADTVDPRGAPSYTGHASSALLWRTPGAALDDDGRLFCCGRAGPYRQAEAKEACTFMIQGTVKWFNEAKGFGFLSREGGPDVFVHHTEIRADGFRTLNEGDRVQFEVVDSPKGPRAANVSRV